MISSHTQYVCCFLFSLAKHILFCIGNLNIILYLLVIFKETTYQSLPQGFRHTVNSLFPTIGLKQPLPSMIINTKLKLENINWLLGGYWQKIENQKQFFIDFSHQKGFDLLKPENWLDVTYEEMKKQVHFRKRLMFKQTLGFYFYYSFSIFVFSY